MEQKGSQYDFLYCGGHMETCLYVKVVGLCCSFVHPNKRHPGLTDPLDLSALRRVRLSVFSP